MLRFSTDKIDLIDRSALESRGLSFFVIRRKLDISNIDENISDYLNREFRLSRISDRIQSHLDLFPQRR